ncbi:hypothetical protein ES332_D05G377800v1 [Gossypium tomentosum]|uniref:Uncharacterized protein n=1 Tax=Gossypium tomentosum TaxID=34277 RepID=A0A5D2L4T2_GOSTO|nr:hypothetical protein ES332_D05G377800v1 [Gossypium tomentosum]
MLYPQESRCLRPHVIRSELRLWRSEPRSALPPRSSFVRLLQVRSTGLGMSLLRRWRAVMLGFPFLL